MADNIKKVTIKFDIDTAALAKGEQAVTGIFDELGKSARKGTLAAMAQNEELKIRENLQRRLVESAKELERVERSNTRKQNNWIPDEIKTSFKIKQQQNLAAALEDVRNKYLQIELTAGRAASKEMAASQRQISQARQSIADIGKTDANQALQDQAKLNIPGVAEYQRVQEQLAARETALIKQVQTEKVNAVEKYRREHEAIHERLYRNVEAKQLAHLQRLTANNIAARDDRGYTPGTTQQAVSASSGLSTNMVGERERKLAEFLTQQDQKRAEASRIAAERQARDDQNAAARRQQLREAEAIAEKSRIDKNLAQYQQHLRGREAVLQNSIQQQLATERHGINSIQVARLKADGDAIRLAEKKAQLQERLMKRVASGQISAASAMQRNARIEQHYQRAVLQSNEALNAKEKALGNNVRQHDAMLLRVGKLIISYNLLRTAYHRFMEGLRNIPEAGIRQQQSEAAVLATFGTVDGSQNLKELRELADYAGASIRDLEESYRRFAPSAILAGATLEQTNAIFRDFTETSTVLHLSTVQTTSLFLALEQMFAKNVVQSEEIKKQLGNVLPGAVEVGAKAWASYTKEVDESGKAVDRSVAGFMKAMQANQVLAREFVPAFAEMYRDMFGGPDDSIFLDVRTQLFSNFKRLLNEYETFSRGMFDLTGNAMNDALKGIASGLHTLNENLHGTMQVVELLGSLFLARLGISAVRSLGTLAQSIFGVSTVLKGLEVTKVYNIGKAWEWVKTTLIGVPALFNPIVLGTIALTAATTKLAMVQQGMEVTYGRFTKASRETIDELMNAYAKGSQEAGYMLQQLTEKSNSWFIQTKTGAVELSTVWDVLWGKISNKVNSTGTSIVNSWKADLKLMEEAGKEFETIMKSIFTRVGEDVTDTLTKGFARAGAIAVASAEATKTLTETKSISAARDTFNEVLANKELEYLGKVQQGFNAVGISAGKAAQQALDFAQKGPLQTLASEGSIFISQLQEDIKVAQAKINAEAQKKALDKSKIGGIDSGEQGTGIDDALISAREKAEISALRALGENAKADRMVLEKEYGATVRIARDTVDRLEEIQGKGMTLLPAQQTELEENKKFLQNYDILWENVGNKASKAGKQTAWAYKEITDSSRIFAAQQQEALRALDESYARNEVSIASYFAKKKELELAAVQVKATTNEEALAQARAKGDLQRIQQFETEKQLLIIETQKVQSELDRQKFTELLKYNDFLKKTSQEYLEFQGKFGEAAKVSADVEFRDSIKLAEANDNKILKDQLVSLKQARIIKGDLQELEVKRGNALNVLNEREQRATQQVQAGLLTQRDGNDVLIKIKAEKIKLFDEEIARMEQLLLLNSEDFALQQQIVDKIRERTAVAAGGQGFQQQRVGGALSFVDTFNDDKANLEIQRQNEIDRIQDERKNGRIVSHEAEMAALAAIDSQYSARTASMYTGLYSNIFGVAADTFSGITDAATKMYGAQSKEARRAFMIEKALRLGQIAMSTAQAVMQALSSVPPPLSFVLAASAGVMGAVQMALVAAQQPPAAHGGLTNVPKEQTYLLDKGERVLSPRQNEDFTKFIKGDTIVNNNNAPQKNNLKIINVIDPSVVGEYLGTMEGEELVMNVVRRNQGGF